MAFLPQVPAGDNMPAEFLAFYLRLPFELPLSQRSFIWTPLDAFAPPPRSAARPRWGSVRFRQFDTMAPNLVPAGFHAELDQLLAEQPGPGQHLPLGAPGHYSHTWCVATVGGDG